MSLTKEERRDAIRKNMRDQYIEASVVFFAAGGMTMLATGSAPAGFAVILFGGGLLSVARLVVYGLTP